MKAYFRWHGHCYEVVNPATKNARYYRGVFNKYHTPNGVSLYDCYEKPSYRKKNAYSDLVDMFSYVTITSYDTYQFTAMSTIEGLNALFVDTRANCYVVADRQELKDFADAMRVGFCQYREEN